MSVICQNFVQNAWRKDLCSNCFKSETDHSDCGYRGSLDATGGRRYVPQATTLYQSRALAMNIHWRPLLAEPVSRIQDRIACRDFGSQTNVAEPRNPETNTKTRKTSTKGILKDQIPNRKPRRPSVGFTSEEPLVIGYGGRDYDSDDSPWELGSDDGSINLEQLDYTEEDRTITKLTKNNTEFNSVNENLIRNTSPPDSLQSTDKDILDNRNHLWSSNRESTSSTSSSPKPENYYYFSTKHEPQKSYSPKMNEQTSYLDECKEMSIIAKEIPGIINSIENNSGSRHKVDNLNKLNRANNCDYGTSTKQDDQDCQNRNSSRYLLITKVQDSYSSDSDYSTSKQTNGESSTDTESFHDAEESLIVPCSSFLHGSVVSNSRSGTRASASNPFETSSVSSADASTFSDDSDSHKPQEVLNNKPRNNHCKSSSSCTTKNPVVHSVTQNKFKATPVQIKDDSRKHPGSNSSLHASSSACDSKNKPTRPKQNNCQLEPKSVENQQKSVNSDKVPPAASTQFHENPSPLNERPKLTKNIQNVEVNEKVTSEHADEANKNSPSTNKSRAKPPGDISEHMESRCQTKSVSENNPEIQTLNFRGTNANPGELKCNIAKQHADLTKQNSHTDDDSCKKWSADEDDWRSVQHTPQSTPSVSSTTDTEDHHENTQHSIYTPNSNGSSARSSPNSKSNRESKLAALALELEKVRCDTSFNSEKESKSLETRHSTRTKSTPKNENDRISKSSESPPAPQNTSGKYPSIRRGRSLVSPNQTPKSSLPDLLPETKTKKGRFSLKKLLKRGKDSDTLVINSPSDYNPKAWKRQTFDRSRLSLEIIHPMDLTTDPNTSADSTPTEDKRASIFSNPAGRHHGKIGSGTTRARSLSALPNLGSAVSEISDLEGSGLRKDNISSLDRPRMDMPRKAGTVAERSKKYKAPRRTPSFSELRSSSTSSGRSTGSGAPSERPPKPPPPPRGKSLPPPQPPTAPPPIPHDKSRNHVTAPARPPPPKIQEENENSSSMSSSPKGILAHVIGDYANLGNIRLNIIPKKPQRPSAISFARDTLETDESLQEASRTNQHQPNHPFDNTYETLEAQEEEDHYTYLDELEAKGTNSQKHPKTVGSEGSVVTITECKHQQQSPKTSITSSPPRPSLILKKPWMNLHASYAAIAAANYESLAELITTAISEGLEKFQKTASTLKWTDFDLESEDAVQTLEDKLVYNAVYKSQPKTKVTLMVTTQKQHTGQSSRNTSRPPVLAAFNDILPKQIMTNADNKFHNYTNSQKATIYVLQRSKTTTVDQFARDSACFQTNQHVHLRNACFVLLQLIHTLKSLQAEGIEEIDYDLSRVLLLHTDVDKPPILVLLPGDKVYLTMTDFYKADVATRKTTLCQTTLQLLFHLLRIKTPKELTTCIVNGEGLAKPVAHTFGVIAKVLSEEKASSLTQAKGLLEYMLWGPVDIKTTGTEEDIDIILQRWLDLQRAQMVKSLVSNLHLKISSNTGFHVYEEYQLIFLLQATVKSLKDIISKL